MGNYYKRYIRQSRMSATIPSYTHDHLTAGIESATVSNRAWDSLSKTTQKALLKTVRERVRLALLMFERRTRDGTRTLRLIIDVTAAPLQTCDRLEERGLVCHICSNCESPYRSTFQYHGTSPKCPKCRPKIPGPDSD